MLDRIHADHFRPLQGTLSTLFLPDGTQLPVQVLAVTEYPRARRHDAGAEERMPFTVDLTALEPTRLLDGPCGVELPELGRVEGIWISRVAVPGTPPEIASFQIVFA